MKNKSLYKQHAYIVVLLFFGILFFPTTGNAKLDSTNKARNPRWAVSIPLEYADNFYRFAPDLYRSAQPDKKAMQEYAAMGIKTVINLRDNHSDDDEATNTNLILKRIPIKTWNISDDQVVQLLVMLRTEKRPILIHCQHGADRTGLMVAMYRIIEQGWSKKDALQELQEGGYGFHSIWRNIPKYIDTVDVSAIQAKVNAQAPKLDSTQKD